MLSKHARAASCSRAPTRSGGTTVTSAHGAGGPRVARAGRGRIAHWRAQLQAHIAGVDLAGPQPPAQQHGVQQSAAQEAPPPQHLQHSQSPQHGVGVCNALGRRWQTAGTRRAHTRGHRGDRHSRGRPYRMVGTEGTRSHGHGPSTSAATMRAPAAGAPLGGTIWWSGPHTCRAGGTLSPGGSGA